MNDIKKILVVEDEAPLRKALGEKLLHERYEVLEAADGEEGLFIALKEKPDLILLDLEMPKMNGTQMLAQLRMHEDGKEIKVIVLTNVTELTQVANVMEQEGTAYLLKSDTDLKEVIDQVRMLI